MFWKTASIPLKVLGDFGQFKKRAQALNVIQGKNLIKSDIFEKASGLYQLSPNPSDYGFLSAFAVRADVPNKNGDAISKEELLRFRPHRRARTFETFILSPLHVNHFSSDPKLARGFIIDSVLNTWDEPFTFVEVVIAVDKTKDRILADSLLTGKINKFSMGSLVEMLECSLSFCRKRAMKEEELCEHLKTSRMQKINGELCFEWNIGVDYEELSVVENPAEVMATTTRILGNAPKLRSILPLLSNEKKAQFSITASSNIVKPLWADLIGIDEGDRRIIAKFIELYRDRFPSSVIKTLEKIFTEVG